MTKQQNIFDKNYEHAVINIVSLVWENLRISGLTRAELGVKAKLSVSKINYVLSGELDKITIREIANIFSVLGLSFKIEIK